MPKWCLNYESGDYEYIDENSYNWNQREYVYNLDDSDYRHEEEECLLWNDDDISNIKNNIWYTLLVMRSFIFQFCMI